MIIRRLDRYTYDVFLYNGWEHWVRVKKGRSSTFRVAGQHVPHAMLKYLDDVLFPGFPCAYESTVEQTVNNLLAI